jgi:hypothetical protein
MTMLHVPGDVRQLTAYMEILWAGAPIDMEIISGRLLLQAVPDARKRAPQLGLERSMLDLTYILIGAAFLGACMLYAVACDNL